METPQNINSVAPFRNYARKYREKGWDIVPLPFRQKSSPPENFTGGTGGRNRFATEAELEAWLADKQWEKGNIAVRVGRMVEVDGEQYEVLGIDVDDYGSKNGYNNLCGLEDALGKFPDTWISSARVDCRSGIRWVLVPYGYEYRGQAADNIDVIQHTHRYGVVFPSWNPDSKAQYYWYAPGSVPNGTDFAGDIPDVKDLALLPKAWFDHVRKGFRSNDPTATAQGSTRELQKWFEDNCGEPDTLCRTVSRALANKTKALQEGTDHHDPLILGHMNLFLLAVEGHTGWRKAVVQFEKSWLKKLEDEGDDANRNLWVAKSELARSRDGAMRKIKGSIDTGTRQLVKKDPCAVKKHELIPEKLTKGQLRLANALVRRFTGKIIYVPNIGWHIWDGKRWKEDALGEVTRAVLVTMKRMHQEAEAKYATAALATTAPNVRDALTAEADKLIADVMSCQTSTAIEGILKIARTLPNIAVDTSSLDSDPYLLNTQTCTLDLRTGEAREYNPQDFITKLCNATFDTTAANSFDAETYCPKWIQFLNQVLPDAQVRDYLAQIIGISLVGTQLEHMLLILHGNGRNGKGVFERVVRHVLGDYAVSAASDLLTQSSGAHTTSQTDLFGKRLAVIDELESGARLSEALVQKLTGDGVHTARRMHKDNIRFKMTWLAMMITNHLPSIEGKGVAIWDRMVVIKFPVYFEPTAQDKHLHETLKTESTGILMWAYDGWRRYQEAGYRLFQPDSVKEAVAEYQDSQDELGLWLRERTQSGEGDTFESRPADLLSDYNQWTLANELPHVPKHKFMEDLRSKGYQYSRKKARFIGLRLDPKRTEFRAKSE